MLCKQRLCIPLGDLKRPVSCVSIIICLYYLRENKKLTAVNILVPPGQSYNNRPEIKSQCLF